MAALQIGLHKTYVVEHLDPELGPWSTLEYVTIAQESSRAGVTFYLSSVPAGLNIPTEISSERAVVVEHRSVEEIFGNNKDRVCLLDPAAANDLSPNDASNFEVFLFGGILGRYTYVLPSLPEKADVYVGDHPPRGELMEHPESLASDILNKLQTEHPNSERRAITAESWDQFK